MKAIVITRAGGPLEIPIEGDRDAVANRYAKLAVAFVDVLSAMGDYETSDQEWANRLGPMLDSSSGLYTVLTYTTALLEQYGGEEGVDLAVLRRYGMDLEAILDVLADRPGTKVEATPERFEIDAGGIRIEVDRRSYAGAVMAHRVRGENLDRAHAEAEGDTISPDKEG